MTPTEFLENLFFAYFTIMKDNLLPIFGFVLVVVLVAGILNFILKK
jgi:hypothetical protein